jgi:ribonuclease P protein component
MFFRFPKSERLKSRKQIASLFLAKQSVGGYPLRFFWLKREDDEAKVPLQVAFSVPKKKFRRAVDRNRLKRLMREAYRLHKHQLSEQLEASSQKLIGMWVYTGKEYADFKMVEKGVQKAFERLMKELRFDK